MAELRVDAVTGRRVLIVPGRAARPITASPASPAPHAPDPRHCPFCPGHEAETPPEVSRTGGGAPNTPGWRVRVVPNLYPIVGNRHRRGPDEVVGAHGAHEVAVLADHARDLRRLEHDEAVEVLTVLRDRARALAETSSHVQVFVNHGQAAGASIAHPHAQLVALPFVPPAVSAALERFTDAGADLIADELETSAAQELRVLDEGTVAAWCPSAAGSPYECRVAAQGAGAHFERASDAEVASVARVVVRLLGSLCAILGDVAYNVVVHTAPSAASTGPPDHTPFFHWYVTVVPRVSVVAGFELGTGLLVNSVAPLDAARELRAELGS